MDYKAYLFLVIAALMFSVQFIFNKQYQKNAGGGLCAGGLFLILHSIWVIIIWGVANEFKITLPTRWAFLYSAIYVGSSALCSVCFLQAVKRTKVAVVTLFELIGGQLIPFVFSLLFTGGWKTTGFLSYLGLAVLIVTCVVGLPGGEKEGKSKFDFTTFLCCMGTFLGNGFVSVATDLYGKNCGDNTTGFLFMNSLLSIGVGIIFVLATLSDFKSIVSGKAAAEQSGKKDFKPIVPIILILAMVSGAYAALNGLGNVFSVECAKTMQGTIQFPVMNSLIIIFTSFIGRIVFKEKFTKKIILSDSLAIVGIILFMVDALILSA